MYAMCVYLYLQIIDREIYFTHAVVLLFVTCRAGRTSSYVVVHAEYACTRYLYWRALLDHLLELTFNC